MKKIIILLITCFVIMLSGCGSSGDEADKAKTEDNIQKCELNLAGCSFELDESQTQITDQNQDESSGHIECVYGDNDTVIKFNYKKGQDNNLDSVITEFFDGGDYSEEKVLTPDNYEITVASSTSQEGNMILWFTDNQGEYYISISNDNGEVYKSILSTLQIKGVNTADDTEETDSGEDNNDEISELIESVDNSNVNDAVEFEE